VPKCIFIVDDSAVIRRALRSLVQCQPGFEVCGESADGVEAIERALELKAALFRGAALAIGSE
jgi:DNA-binding NarL/FixJ family response regulator